ncbi:MAG: Hpt domain-containing protein [Terracidiphilus sp.]
MDPATQPAPASPPALSEAPALAVALDRLWSRFQPEIEQRLVILESSAAAAAVCALTRTQQEAAHSAAHKLAGVLGTFGLAEGTALAREMEQVFDSEDAPNAAGGERLVLLAAGLRTIIASRK